MSTQSRIEWTEQTWNPAVGCSKVSPACAHCYAEAMAKRLQAMGVNGYENGFKLTLLPYRLDEPLRRRKPTVYFVNSMSDLFHEDIPFTYIAQEFEVIRKATLSRFSPREPSAWLSFLSITRRRKMHGLELPSKIKSMEYLD